MTLSLLALYIKTRESRPAFRYISLLPYTLTLKKQCFRPTRILVTLHLNQFKQLSLSRYARQDEEEAGETSTFLLYYELLTT
jgi:hypothetical protein